VSRRRVLVAAALTADGAGLICAARFPDSPAFGETPVRWRRLRSVPADGSPGMADGGSGDTDTTNSGPTWGRMRSELA
jgi:hypothetical protein